MWELSTFSFTPRICGGGSSNKVFIRGKNTTQRILTLSTLQVPSTADGSVFSSSLLWKPAKQNKICKRFHVSEGLVSTVFGWQQKLKKMWVLAPTMKASAIHFTFSNHQVWLGCYLWRRQVKAFDLLRLQCLLVSFFICIYVYCLKKCNECYHKQEIFFYVWFFFWIFPTLNFVVQ